MEWIRVEGNQYSHENRSLLHVQWTEAWSNSAAERYTEKWIIRHPKDGRYYIANWGGYEGPKLMLGPYETLDTAKVTYLLTGGGK